VHAVPDPVEVLLLLLPPPEPPLAVVAGVLEQATIVNAEPTEARRNVEENKANEERVRMDELRGASGPGRISEPRDVFTTEQGRPCDNGARPASSDRRERRGS
jgi:hypothetical protein